MNTKNNQRIYAILLACLRKLMFNKYMTNRDPKELVQELAESLGKNEAKKFLVAEGISTSTADKLVGNRYASEVRGLVQQAIIRACESARKRIA